MTTEEPASVIAARQLAADAHARRHFADPGTRAVVSSARRHRTGLTEGRTVTRKRRIQAQLPPLGDLCEFSADALAGPHDDPGAEVNGEPELVPASDHVERLP
ncbi:hypothetical protein [Modestobacter lapidis]